MTSRQRATSQPDQGAASAELSELIAGAVLEHPAVVRLDGGSMGLVTTHLPGRKVVGVHLAPGEPVEISVVLVMGARVPEVSTALRAAVRKLVGDVPVHITVTDLIEPDLVESRLDQQSVAAVDPPRSSTKRTDS